MGGPGAIAARGPPYSVPMLHPSFLRPATLALGLLLLASPAGADVRLPALFGDGMVLQRDTQVAVWGWADPGEEVRVVASWSDALRSAVAGPDGRWELRLPTGEAGGPHTLAFLATNRIELEDVLFGEVWVCSGQSNMEWSIDRCAPLYTEAKAKMDHPRLRLFDVERAFSTTPREDCEGSWSACTPESVAGFSAVAYFYGLELMNELDVPVGLIGSNWGGTRCEAWTSAESIRRRGDFDDQLALAAREAALPADSQEKRSFHHNHSTALFNGMIAPLLPYGIRGAIWYQGESNRGRAAQYHSLFPDMIADWRRHWGRGDFPFYFVQIAPFGYGGDKAHQPALLREAQRLALRVPNTGMAVTMDIGDPADIHPRNKHDVGKRLALWALHGTYGRDVGSWSGPLFRSASREGDALRVRFDHAEGGLVCEGAPTHFEIAGADGTWMPAEARIDGETLLVRADGCPEPVSVRYGWGNADMPGLENAAGLPASSFCSDPWPPTTGPSSPGPPGTLQRGKPTGP